MVTTLAERRASAGVFVHTGGYAQSWVQLCLMSLCCALPAHDESQVGLPPTEAIPYWQQARIVRVMSASVARMNLVCLPAESPRPATAAPRRARAKPPPCVDSGARRGPSEPAPRGARSSRRTQDIRGYDT